MKLNTSDLKAKARGHLSGRYATLVIAYMLTHLITNLPTLVVSSMKINSIPMQELIDISVSMIVLFITAIFVVGQNRICLKYARSNELILVNEMWYGFKNLADKTIVSYFLILLRMIVPTIPFIVCMSFLLNDRENITWISAGIITGILMLVASVYIFLNYALVLYLILDHPDAAPGELLKKSRELMRGRRLKFLTLQLSFIGMYLLVLLSFGFGIYWVYPYVRMTTTEFYLSVIGEDSLNIPVLEGDPSDPNYYKEVY